MIEVRNMTTNGPIISPERATISRWVALRPTSRRLATARGRAAAGAETAAVLTRPSSRSALRRQVVELLVHVGDRIRDLLLAVVDLGHVRLGDLEPLLLPVLVVRERDGRLE